MSWLGNLLGRIKADSGDRSPYGDFWFTPVGMNSVSGVRVTPDLAMQLAAVYAAVRVLAETFAALPFQLYRRAEDGTRTQERDHWLYRLLARRPNAWQNAFEWREMLQGHLALRGNAFNQIVSNGAGEIEQLIPLHPDRIKIELLDGGNWRYRVKNRDGLAETVLPRAEVWHLRGLSSDGIVGISPIQMARDAVGIGLAAQGYGARYFANDARPAGIIKHPSNFKTQDTRDAWRESWQQQQGGANRGKVAVLEYGMEYQALGVDNADAQFLETRKFQVTEIARIFRVPPHLIGDLERATFTNIEQQSLEFIMHTMTPWAERWEASIEADLLLEVDGEGEDGELEVGFDFTNLMRGDSAARAAYYGRGILDGWMSRNEARVAEGLNPKDELDTFLQPLNMVPAGTPPPKPGVQTPAKPPADEGQARLRALLQANATRLSRRMCRDAKAPPADVLVECLAVSRDAALTWIAAAGEPPYDEATLTESLLELAMKGSPA